MKSNDRPELIQRLGQSLYTYNHNVVQVDEGYECVQLLFDHIPTYADVVNRIVTDKYSNGAEQATLRKGALDSNNAEFVEYNEFVENIKQLVKSELQNAELIND